MIEGGVGGGEGAFGWTNPRVLPLLLYTRCIDYFLSYASQSWNLIHAMMEQLTTGGRGLGGDQRQEGEGERGRAGQTRHVVKKRTVVGDGSGNEMKC